MHRHLLPAFALLAPTLTVWAQDVAFRLTGEPTELARISNGAAVTPTKPPTLQGTLRLAGTGVVSFTRQGVAFTPPGATNVNAAYYLFSGGTLGTIFSPNKGELRVTVTSTSSFADRKATRIPRCLYEVSDANRAVFSFQTEVSGDGRLIFYYRTGQLTNNYYYVPAGTEEALFGLGKTLDIRIVWDGRENYLYLNGTLARRQSYSQTILMWGADSLFSIGGVGRHKGYYPQSDYIRDLEVLSAPAESTPERSLTIVLPNNSISMSGQVVLGAQYKGVAPQPTVEFTVDGNPIGTTQNPPYTLTLDTAHFTNGGHDIQAIARATGMPELRSAISTIIINNPILDIIPPTQPTGLFGSKSGTNDVLLTWNASTDNIGVRGYWIFRNRVMIKTTAETTFIDRSMPMGQQLQYSVLAFDTAGNISTLSATISMTIPDSVAPSAPTGLMSTSSGGSMVQLQWSPSTDNLGVQDYNVVRDNTVIGVTSATIFNDTSVAAGHTYSYAIQAFDAARNASVVSASLLVSLPTVTPTRVPSGNGIVIRNNSNVAQSNYPVQIGRVFAEDDSITDFPEALLDNSLPIPTQADVKSRWSNGRVKHVILSFIVPIVPAQTTVSIGFRNSKTNDNTPLSSGEMLEEEFDFDAGIGLNNGRLLSASARAMLVRGDYEYWTKGPIATTVILRDHTARQYDLGFDSYRPFRPIFHATFWPGLKKVKVRYIGEVSNTEELEDIEYALSLTIGNASPKTVYSKPTFRHHPGARWTKVFWIHGEPAVLEIDHNTPYLISTKFLPNFDLSKSIPEVETQRRFQQWTSQLSDIFDAGSLQKGMASAGGRPEVGLVPGWTVWWLYTFDERMRAIAFGNADLGAAFPMHFREGNNAKYFDREKAIPGIGRVLSIRTRPTLTLGDGNSMLVPQYAYVRVEDRMKVVGTYSDNGWRPDNAHQPDLYSVQYALTGDFWYLEELWFWNSWNAAHDNGAASTVHYGRGPDGSVGGLRTTYVPRASAWPLRNRVLGAFVSPDSTPEKAYMEGLISDAIAIWEGERNILGTEFQGSRNWQWGRTIGIGTFSTALPTLTMSSPLQFWSGGINDARYYDVIDKEKVAGAQSAWQQDYLLLVLGRAAELGYPTKALLSWVAFNRVGQIIDPTSNWQTVSSAYATPVVSKSTGQYFTSWREVNASYNPTAPIGDTYSRHLFDGDHGYPYVLMAALAMARDEVGGQAAWDKAASELLCNPALSNNPKWSIIPRGFTSLCPVR